MPKQRIEFSALEVGSTASERARYRELGTPPEEALRWIKQLEILVYAHDKKFELIKAHNPKMAYPDPEQRIEICLDWLRNGWKHSSMDAYAKQKWSISGRTVRRYLEEMHDSIPRDSY